VNADFQARVRASFARQQVMSTIGAELLLVEAGRVEIALPFRADLTQQHGFLHAGIITTIADSSCGYAAYSLMAAPSAVLSIEFKINLLRPARGERFIARGRVLKPGRNIMACASDVFAMTAGEETLIATMLASIMVVNDRPDLNG
jgi:uncharacterized protein (TIGR00369 family)